MRVVPWGGNGLKPSFPIKISGFRFDNDLHSILVALGTNIAAPHLSAPASSFRILSMQQISAVCAETTRAGERSFPMTLLGIEFEKNLHHDARMSALSTSIDGPIAYTMKIV